MGSAECAAVPCVCNFRQSTPLCAVTGLSCVGSPTIAAVGLMGRLFRFCLTKFLMPVIPVSSLIVKSREMCCGCVFCFE